MQRLICALAVLCLLPASTAGQQPNQPPRAALLLDGSGSGPYPLRATRLATSGLELGFLGGPLQSFEIFLSEDGLRPAGTSRPGLGGQLIDLDDRRGLRSLFRLQGLPGQTLNAAGRWTQSFVIAAGTVDGASLALQGAALDPTAPGIIPVSLSAALLLQVERPNGVILPLSLPADGSVEIDFSTRGMPDFPFYESRYSSVWVNSNGNLSFGSGSGDFTPSPLEFEQSQPRIAAFWTDLDPSLGGAVVGAMDANAAGGPQTQVLFREVPLWSNIGGPYSFTIELDHTSGDIQCSYDRIPTPLIFDAFVGISPGFMGVVPGTPIPSPARAFSASNAGNPLTTAPLESAWEWFGDPTTHIYYTQTFLNPFDLDGRTIEFQATGAGASGATYRSWVR